MKSADDPEISQLKRELRAMSVKNQRTLAKIARSASAQAKESSARHSRELLQQRRVSAQAVEDLTQRLKSVNAQLKKIRRFQQLGKTE
jgi:hypothetical protein